MRNVALFVTCLTDQFYPQVGLAVTGILEHFGCRVHFPEPQTCCGQPFYNNGFEAEAAGLAKRMVEIFEGFEFIVTPSASCCAMVRHHFPRLLADQPAWTRGVQRLAGRTYEFVEFLEKVLKVDFGLLKLPEPQSLTYHYNCHLRSLGIAQEPTLRLLEEIRNADFRPMENAEQCCGFGGTFATKFPAVSAAIAHDKARWIAESSAEVAICNDAGCSMNIAGALHRANRPVRVRHVAELIAEALGIKYADV